MTRLVVICSVMLMSAVVFAFPFNRSWHESATGVAGTNRAGAGGLYGTGGRTDKGVKCSHCHVKGEGKIGVNVTANPAFPMASGELKYVPGQRYVITVQLTGEHRGGGGATPGPTNNKNGMAVTIEDAGGKRAGHYIADAGQDSNACPQQNPYPGGTGAVSPTGKTTFMYGDCHGVLSLDHKALTQWTFTWDAPASGAGDLKMFVGVVDGNTEGESSLDDDTAERAITLRQGP
jgi:hypothetical protein